MRPHPHWWWNATYSYLLQDLSLSITTSAPPTTAVTIGVGAAHQCHQRWWSWCSRWEGGGWGEWWLMVWPVIGGSALPYLALVGRWVCYPHLCLEFPPEKKSKCFSQEQKTKKYGSFTKRRIIAPVFFDYSFSNICRRATQTHIYYEIWEPILPLEEMVPIQVGY